jgi:hypothetical protein
VRRVVDQDVDAVERLGHASENGRTNVLTGRGAGDARAQI